MWVINRISQICLCSDFYVDMPTVMLTFLTVLDGARVGISNYIGLVCESCAWTWILLVFKDLRTNLCAQWRFPQSGSLKLYPLLSLKDNKWQKSAIFGKFWDFCLLRDTLCPLNAPSPPPILFFLVPPLFVLM